MSSNVRLSVTTENLNLKCVMDKNKLTVDLTHHKRSLIAPHRCYLSEHTQQTRYLSSYEHQCGAGLTPPDMRISSRNRKVGE